MCNGGEQNCVNSMHIRTLEEEEEGGREVCGGPKGWGEEKEEEGGVVCAEGIQSRPQEREGERKGKSCTGNSNCPFLVCIGQCLVCPAELVGGEGGMVVVTLVVQFLRTSFWHTSLYFVAGINFET